MLSSEAIVERHLTILRIIFVTISILAPGSRPVRTQTWKSPAHALSSVPASIQPDPSTSQVKSRSWKIEDIIWTLFPSSNPRRSTTCQLPLRKTLDPFD